MLILVVIYTGIFSYILFDDKHIQLFHLSLIVKSVQLNKN